MRFSPGLPFLVFSLQQILALNPEVSIKKCCPEGQIYNSAVKRCVQGTGNVYLLEISDNFIFKYIKVNQLLGKL